MAAPGTAVGLSSTDLEQIRGALQSGRKPRVVFTASAGQVAGQVGQVVQLTDPEVSDEWIVVRFGRDELPFSVVDLAIPPKSASVRRADPRPAPEFRLATPPTVPTPREEIPMPTATRTGAGGGPNGVASNGAASNGVASNGVASNGVASNGAASNGAVLKGAAAVQKSARAAKPKVPATLTVTLAYTDREWTVAANLGTKALAKPYVIKPTDALRMVALLDVPGVHDAVESIIAAERVEAEGRAQRLRAELAEIESRLSELTNRS